MGEKLDGTESGEITEHAPKRYSNVTLSRMLKGTLHQHSHFTDVNGKRGTFDGFDFSYSVFTRGFFHGAKFSNCKFVGVHFVDCNFRNSELRNCDFSYASFFGTRIPTSEILKNLPSWPNARRELLQSLRRNAVSMADYQSEKAFIIREIDAAKEHYRNAWNRTGSYYYNKYGPRFRWVGAGMSLLALKVDNFLWGHGERLWKTPIALALFLGGFSVALTLHAVPNNPTLDVLLDHLGKSFIYNINMFLGLPDATGVKGGLFLDWSIVLIRYLALGVLVAALYRRLSHR